MINDLFDVVFCCSVSPMSGIPPRFLLGPTSLPVEAFGSLLGEEIVATWRRSLERSLLASSPPSQPHCPTSALTPSHHLVNESSSSPPVPPSDSSPHESSMHADMSMGDNSCTLNGSSSGPTPDRIPFRYEDSLIPKSDPMEARLQEMLRYNMDKFGSQCLDTLQISRRVRELLSIHNIGQRLFAKYILGLSQGTVSELLSKPKPWDKLTEKGRDSYRKMHAWAADDASVMLLKSLIPKKGKEFFTGFSLPFAVQSFRMFIAAQIKLCCIKYFSCAYTYSKKALHLACL
ncbi:Homeobox protein cut [Orchesella cincta]|uniref:Homeobox protein cut n=1 Tax=Orchesella cincta TaxID=48709 RepID=A0A1D2NDK2_ORCCI|nr:Homeobox protein cut [Orchesella cincta]